MWIYLSLHREYPFFFSINRAYIKKIQNLSAQLQKKNSHTSDHKDNSWELEINNIKLKHRRPILKNNPLVGRMMK